MYAASSIVVNDLLNEIHRLRRLKLPQRRHLVSHARPSRLRDSMSKTSLRKLRLSESFSSHICVLVVESFAELALQKRSIARQKSSKRMVCSSTLEL